MALTKENLIPELALSHVEDQEVRMLEHLIPDSKEYSKILAKVDWHIVPIMLACYTLQFLDKVLVNYANVMGLQQDLHMKGNDFSWMATAFFIGFAVAEVPQGYFLQRYPISRVLGINILLWGVVIACTAASQRYADILALRILLGCFEAVISPALVLTTSMWYTKRQSAPRYGIWYCGLGVAQILGGLISFGAQHGPHDGLSGWRIMMVAIGAFNMLVALIVLAFLPTSLESASFLTDKEKESLRRMLILDQAGNGSKVFRVKGLWEVFSDLQVWLLFLLTMLILMPNGIITTFSATLIHGFGYNAKQSALLNMPSGVVSIIATFGSTYAILRGYPRWLCIVLVLIPALIGAALMSFGPKNSQGTKLAGIYLINFDVAPMAIIFSWVGANTAGYTKKVAANAIVAIGFSLANIIGPQTFQAHDAPEYLPAKITVLASCSASMVVSTLLWSLYVYRNKSAVQNRQVELSEVTTEQHLAPMAQNNELTDRSNKAFVYVY